MKIRRKLIAVLALICVLCTVFAFGCAPEKTCYTVTFMDGQTKVGQIEVDKGKKIPEYPNVTHDDENDYLDGWYMDEGLTKEWNKNTERVTKDVTLYVKFLNITTAPGNHSMEREAFTNTLTWLQRGVTEATAYSVELFESEKVSATDYEYKEEVYYTEENCDYTVENYKGEPDIFKIKWTAKVKPVGGIYGARVTCGQDAVTFGELLYKGTGTQENPYLINDATDFSAINTSNVSSDKYYKMLQPVVVRVASSKVAGYTFDGNLDGNGKTVTIEASDCGLFATLGGNALIYDLNVEGSVPAVSENCAGVIASVNNGTISYCNVSATITSDLGTIGTLEADGDGIVGGAGGIVGVNNGTVTNCAYSATAQASVGAGGIAVVNRGVISYCTNGGTIGAGNANETGSSTKKYSYMGGIVAVNYGTVSNCATTDSGKLLAQRSESGESPNNNIGGIVAYNAEGATITECRFDGIRVHGNKNVGGIAGENAGNITFCYVAGAYKSGSKLHSYIGGYSEVGGIAGLTSGNGSIERCFVTANVYAYGATAYGVAQSSENCVYINGNLDIKETANLTAPAGNDNIVKEVTDEDRTTYATKNYILKLTNEQLIALNGVEENGKFTGIDDTAVKLVNEDIKTVKEHTVTVKLHGNGEKVYEIKNTSSDTVPLGKNNAPVAEEGYYLAGWAMKEGGKIVFGTKATGYSDLEALGLSEINLYPVYVEGEDPLDKVLDIAVYAQYVEEDIINALKGAFEIYCAENGVDVKEFRYTMIGNSKTGVSAFCDEVGKGDYNVMFGQRANLTITVIGNKDTLLVVDGSVRRIAKLSEGTASNAFYDFVLNNPAAKKILDPTYITEDEAQKIEITLMNGDGQYGEKITVSNATDAEKVTLPDLTVESGKVFKGWALNKEAVENEVLLKGEINYADITGYATDGKLTLHARIEQGNQKTLLRVGYYTNSSNPVSDNDKKAIKDAFALINPDVEIEFHTFTYSKSGYPITAMVTDINNWNSDEDTANNIDCLFNFPSAGTILNGLNYVTDATAQVGSGNKYIVQVTDSQVAKQFFEFAKTDATITTI
ncbi:MAG: hypothetical protein HDQ88_11930 [Clostridia bacterium]|nr:hypothetical protein [Clostridia bacterium]